MTDEQIIKKWNDEIEKIKKQNRDDHAIFVFDEDLFGLINLVNRQKAEIAKKDTEIDILIRKKESLRDEICKLQNEVGHWKRTADYNAQKYAELIKEMAGDTNEQDA